MSDTEKSTDGIRQITEAAVLSAMAHPFRARLIDTLKVDGPSTVSALAQHTGQAVGSVSHHLKVLADVALVEQVPELARDRRERWWRLVDKGWHWSTSDFADDPVAATVAQAAESAHFNRQVARTHEWLDSHDPSGAWADAAFATQNWLHLTADELHELGTEIVALLRRWEERPQDDGLERHPVLVFSRGFPSRP